LTPISTSLRSNCYRADPDNIPTDLFTFPPPDSLLLQNLSSAPTRSFVLTGFPCKIVLFPPLVEVFRPIITPPVPCFFLLFYTLFFFFPTPLKKTFVCTFCARAFSPNLFYCLLNILMLPPAVSGGVALVLSLFIFLSIPSFNPKFYLFICTVNAFSHPFFPPDLESQRLSRWNGVVSPDSLDSRWYSLSSSQYPPAALKMTAAFAWSLS